MDIAINILIIILLLCVILGFILTMYQEIHFRKELHEKELDKLELEMAILRKKFSDLCKK